MTTCQIRARLAHIIEHDNSGYRLEYWPDAILSVVDGRVEAIEDAEQAIAEGLDTSTLIDKRPALLMPGFIDAHVHAPQTEIIAAYGKQLLDWLEKYTFPAEIKYGDPDFSFSASADFANNLLRHGTTSAMVFTTRFAHNTQHIFDAFFQRNMRVIAGKVLMDRSAPDALLDGPEWLSETQGLIDAFHGKGRLGYALTPRFSITSTPEQLKQCGSLLTDYPDLWIQTHLSENPDEIQAVRGLFPEAKDYLDTYEMFGLHTDKTVFAHCVHLNDDEITRISELGSSIAFCPSSNMFLGSGLLNIDTLNKRGISFALATDVGAGTSLSMFKTMTDAYKVAQLTGYSLSASEAYYSATLGAAKALKLDKYIGNLEKGKEADFIVINPALDETIAKRIEHCRSIDEELFVYMIMASENIVEQTYIAGELKYAQSGTSEGAAA